MDVRYSVSSEVQTSTESAPGYFKFTAPDGSEWKLTKQTLAQWIDEGGDGDVGVVYAKSQYVAAMNLTFTNWIRDGYTNIEFGTDGEPISWESGNPQG